MDYELIKSFEGKSAKITLLNEYWYRASNIKVTKTTVTFQEQHGETVCVTPEAIMMILPMNKPNGDYHE